MNDSILSIIIIMIAIILFATEKIPLAMTSILASLSMAIFGVISYSDALIGFGSTTVMMVIGMIIIGNAVFETGLAQYLADVFLYKVIDNEKKFLLIIMLLGALLSAFMSNTATVALIMPIIASISNKSNGVITKKNTTMALGFSAVAGGACTIVGSTPQLVAQGILSQTENVRTLGFFELGKVGFPIVFIIILFYLTIGYKLQSKLFNFNDINQVENKSNTENLNKSKIKMIISALVLIGCIIGFVLELWNVGIIAILGASILIVTGCISEKKAYSTMDWRTVVIIGGAMGFSKGLEVSGGGELIANAVLSLVGGQNASSILVIVLLSIISVLMGNFMSHTATASMMTPISIFIAQSIGIDPTILVITVIMACNNASATPVGTPPITLTLAVGYRFKDYLIIGGILTLIRTVATILLIFLIYLK